jgi:mono/diheme cytochrome c family protein
MPPAKVEPGRDPEMVQRTRKLNLAFALSSLGLLLVLSLMVWADYDREWKDYQKAFNRLEVRYTQEQIKETLGSVDADRLKQVEADLARGRQEEAARRGEVRKLEAALREVGGRWYAADQDFRFTKARIDVARYEYDEAVNKKHSNAARLKAHLDELERRWNEYRLGREAIEAEQAALQAQLDAIERTRVEAEKARAEMLLQKTVLDARLRKIEPGFVSFVRNLPILDLANPSLKVAQIMPANLFDDVNFTGTPKVDRCTTCHLAIDKKGYEDRPQPFRTHPDMELYLRGPHAVERMGCTGCHQGRGRATGFQQAAHTPSTPEQEQAWGKYTGTRHYDALHYWDFPMTSRGHTESQCRKCHQGVVEVPQAERLNTGVMLIERYGCFGCHKIKGWEGLRKVGPDLTKVASKTNPEWAYRWIKEPRAFRPTRMPQVWDVRVDETADQKARNDAEANAVTAYIFEKSQRESYPAAPKGDLAAGRAAFESVGCLACHRIGTDARGVEGFEMASFRTHGPNLDGTGSKVDAGWLYAWVRNPKGYWHETKMPSLRLTEREAADITAYLMSLKDDAFTARPRPALDSKVRDTIVREYLLALNSVQQADARLTAMSDHERTLYLGEKTIARYGCFGCHTIPGFEKASPIGVELTEEGSKLVERLDFGFEEGKIAHTLPAWLHRKLTEPRVFDRNKDKRPEDLLRMPKFHLGDDEADAIVTAVLSLTKEQIPLAAQKQLGAADHAVQKGARLVRDLNCQGCHRVGAKGGSIQAVIHDQLVASGGDPIQTVALAPPLLYNEKSKVGEGARVRTPWLHGFLEDPSNTIRPWLTVRMPTFEFSEEQLNALTQYFAALDGSPYPYEPRPTYDAQTLAVGKDLFGKWQCVRCHVVAGKLPQQDPANMAPDLAKVNERLRPAWVAQWLADPARIQPGTRMPANFPQNPEENAYPDILGGDQQKQIEAVTGYMLTLGGGAGARAGGGK